MKLVFVSLLVFSCLFGYGLSDGQHHGGHRGMSKEHIKEELHEMLPENEYDGTNLETDEAMELHYFKLHDYDKNDKLDGLEMGAAMTHYHEADENGKEKSTRVDISDKEYFDMIAQILKDDDLNDDGYVDFYEFMQAQKRNIAGTPDADTNVI